MSNQYNHTGIECTIGRWDSPDSIEYATVIFGEAPDTDDQDDDGVFYYIDETEQAHLYKCISEHRDKCAWGKEWYIDLTDEYALIVGDSNKKCIECSEPVDYDGGDDSRWSPVKEAYVCWGCYESAQQYASTVQIVDGEEIRKIYVGDLDIHDEYGDPIDSRKLDIKREYVSTGGWRGYYNTTIEGWVDVLDGWTTGGWDDPIARRKADFNEWADSLLTQEIYPPCSVAIVADPTSNVFSTAVTVLVKKDNVESFREWLADDYDNLYNALT